MIIDFELPTGKPEEKTVNFQADNTPENPFDLLEEKSNDFWKYLTAIITFVTISVFAVYSVPIIGLIVSGFFSVGIFRLKNIYEKNKKYKFVARLTTPIFIVSFDIDDNSVYCRKTEAENLRKKAGRKTQYAPTPPVYDLYMGDEGETEDEWQIRKLAFKNEMTKLYHKTIKQRNEGYYYRFILKQKDYPWEEKEIKSTT